MQCGDTYCSMKGTLAERKSGGTVSDLGPLADYQGHLCKAHSISLQLRFSFHFVNSYLIPSHEELNFFLSHCVVIYSSLI